MIKITEYTDYYQYVFVGGQRRKKGKKTFMCPHCGAEIEFYTYSPLSCPFCRSGVTDIDKLMTDKPCSRIAFHLEEYV